MTQDVPAPRETPRPVFLHVGLAKSGTTYLQHCLWAHRDALRERGLSYPGQRQTMHFRAAVDLRGTGSRWGMDPERLAGTWDRLAALADRAPGAAVISHEVLAACSSDQVRRAVDSFGDREVHVVLTARDLGRQIVAHWQEMIKNGSTTSFAEFADEVVRTTEEERSAAFWRGQDLAAVLERWAGGGIPPHRVHVLPVGAPGADADALWHTFGEVVGVDTTTLPPPERGSNPSLGRQEVALLREVNRVLDGRIEQPAYRFVVKQWFAQGLLPGRDPTRLGPTPALHAALSDVAQGFVRLVRSRGYAVHGELDDLLPGPLLTDATGQDDVDPEAAAALSVAVLAEALEEVARLRDANAALRREARVARREAESARRDPPRPLPEPAREARPARWRRAWRGVRARAARWRRRGRT